jgi:hypothetical protein
MKTHQWLILASVALIVLGLALSQQTTTLIQGILL